MQLLFAEIILYSLAVNFVRHHGDTELYSTVPIRGVVAFLWLSRRLASAYFGVQYL